MDLENICQKAGEYSLKGLKAVGNHLISKDITDVNKRTRTRLKERDKDRPILGKIAPLITYVDQGIGYVLRYTPLVLGGLVAQEYFLGGGDFYMGTFITAAFVQTIDIRKTSEDILREDTIDAFTNFAHTLKAWVSSRNNLFDSLENLLGGFDRLLNENSDFKDYMMNQRNLLPDPYGTLGLASGVSEEKVKSTYWEIARECHPDLNNGGDEEKTQKFMKATKAYNQITGKLNK